MVLFLKGKAVYFLLSYFSKTLYSPSSRLDAIFVTPNCILLHARIFSSTIHGGAIPDSNEYQEPINGLLWVPNTFGSPTTQGYSVLECWLSCLQLPDLLTNKNKHAIFGLSQRGFRLWNPSRFLPATRLIVILSIYCKYWDFLSLPCIQFVIIKMEAFV